jgi:hypothetical protein
MEGNADVDVVISEVGKAFAIPTLCIQQGWCPVIHSGFQNMTFKKMYVWGDKFVQMLKPYNPSQKFIVSGSHVLQGLHRSKLARIDEHTRITIGFFLQSPGVMLPKIGFDNFLSLIFELAIGFPDTNFFIREHPSYPLADDLKIEFCRLQNISLLPPESFSLGDVFQRINLTVSVYSTAILESLAANVVPIICGMGNMPSYYPDLASEGLALQVNGISEAKRLIGRVIMNPTILKECQNNICDRRSEYFSFIDSARFIADEIKTLLH